MIELHLFSKFLLGKTLILPGCAASKELFDFLNKKHIFPDDLPRLARMGFKLNILGRIDTIVGQLDIENEDYEIIERNRVKIAGTCPTCGTVQEGNPSS